MKVWFGIMSLAAFGLAARATSMSLAAYPGAIDATYAGLSVAFLGIGILSAALVVASRN